MVFQPLDKAGPPFPPKRHAAEEAGRNGGAETRPPARSSGPPGGTDDDTDQGDDGGDEADAGAGDDMPQNPVETITKLASIIVVIAGSLQQAMGAGDQPTTTADQSGGQAGDPRNVGLQRGEPILDQPLAKILAGEAEINIPGMGDVTLSNALDELIKARKQLPGLQKQLGEKDAAFLMLKQRYEELAGQPMPAKGAAKTFAVSKAEDGAPGAATTEGDMVTVERLAKQDEEGGAAAKFLIGRVHQGGGTPLVPPS
jgi:hypothetical protein